MPFWKKSEESSDANNRLAELETSIAQVKSRLRDQQMPLTDLFALLGEDDRQILSALGEKRRYEQELQSTSPGDPAS